MTKRFIYNEQLGLEIEVNRHEIGAFRDLQRALGAATVSGLFDKMTVAKNGEAIINAFCDFMSACEACEFINNE